MYFRILVDGKEKIISKYLPDHSRQTENKVRKEIIDYYLDDENAYEVLIMESYREDV